MGDFFKTLFHEFKLPLENPVLVFSLILFIILLSPILLKRLNIPGIIGLIISGVIIGPHGLNILAKNSAVDLFSTIGLLYIMFIAGLELDMNDFKANKNKSLLFGFFTFTLPLVIGFPVCFYLLGYGFNAAFLTASMFATHTLIAYPIVSKLGISKNEAIAITVGGTILTDTGVLLILAIIMGNHQGNLNVDFWIRLGISLLIFSLIMFLAIPKIAKWFFRKLESEKHSHYIFVLSVVFFAAFLAQAAGVEPIIGAFVAGLALNKLIPQSSALMNRIEFIGNSLFIPFFLISVGMLVDVRIILHGSGAIVVAACLTLVSLTGKWLAALFTQLVFKYSNAQRQVIFGLSSAHAAATLAVILVGFKAGILDENILNGTVILILITSIVASFATEKAGKKMAIQTAAPLMEQKRENEFVNEHILLPVGNIENKEKILELSLLLKDQKSSNPISILSVLSNDMEAEVNVVKARATLQSYVSDAAATETKFNLVTTLDHNIASGISRVSKEILSSILLMGWPGRTGIFDKFMGGKLDAILSSTDKTIIMCDLKKPLFLNKHMNVVVTPLAEREQGFELWFNKLAKISRELTLPVQIFCNPMSMKAIKKLANTSKISLPISFTIVHEWENILRTVRQKDEDDLFVFISARKGSISYHFFLEGIQAKIERFFPENNKIIIYPRQNNSGGGIDAYDEISADNLMKPIHVIEKLGKGIARILKR
ncbi:MAG: cation:proton antiporter [Ginsengibacter sp.]